jgi:Flp pilus assembly pilin Flp
MLNMLQQLWKDEEGPTTVEYAIMLVLVALAVAAFGPGLSGAVTGVFQSMIDALTGA